MGFNSAFKGLSKSATFTEVCIGPTSQYAVRPIDNILEKCLFKFGVHAF